MKRIDLLLIIIFLFILINNTSASTRTEEMKPSPNYIVILVHGIGADKNEMAGDWGNLKEYFEKPKSSGGLGLYGYVYNYSFSDPLQSSITSAHELGDKDNDLYWIGRALKDFKQWYASAKGYKSLYDIPQSEIPNKYVIIAHSMGGPSFYASLRTAKLIELARPNPYQSTSG